MRNRRRPMLVAAQLHSSSSSARSPGAAGADVPAASIAELESQRSFLKTRAPTCMNRSLHHACKISPSPRLPPRTRPSLRKTAIRPHAKSGVRPCAVVLFMVGRPSAAVNPSLLRGYPGVRAAAVTQEASAIPCGFAAKTRVGGDFHEPVACP